MATRVKIKICGLQTLKDIEKINDLEIDYVGFIFAPSPRRISLDQALMLKKALNPAIKTVGVFVNEELGLVNEIAKTCSLDLVQLHGDESPAYCQQIIRPVWKALSIGSLEDVQSYKRYPMVAGILLDTYVRGVAGGSGQTFDWAVARGIAGENIILAGGLTAENVRHAAEIVRPQVVDVSSGVESNGVKDQVKIKMLIRSVKEYE